MLRPRRRATRSALQQVCRRRGLDSGCSLRLVDVFFSARAQVHARGDRPLQIPGQRDRCKPCMRVLVTERSAYPEVSRCFNCISDSTVLYMILCKPFMRVDVTERSATPEVSRCFCCISDSIFFVQGLSTSIRCPSCPGCPSKGNPRLDVQFSRRAPTVRSLKFLRRHGRGDRSCFSLACRTEVDSTG